MGEELTPYISWSFLMVSFSPETRVLFKISFRMAVYILSLTVELLAFICVIPFFAVVY